MLKVKKVRDYHVREEMSELCKSNWLPCVNRLNGMARLVCLISITPFYGGTTWTIFLWEQEGKWAVPHVAPPSTAHILLHSNGARQGNASEEEVRWEPWVPGEKLVRTIWYQEDFWHGEKVSAAQDFAIFASGWRPQAADAGLPVRWEQLRTRGQERQWKKTFLSSCSSTISQN